MSVLDAICGELAPTATYARRAWWWMPEGEGSGRLTVSLQKSRRPGAKVEVDTYAVEEEHAPGFPGRVFLILNQTDPTQPDVYRCSVADDPRRSTCTCKAGLCRVASGCKHEAALRDVIENAGL